MADKVTVKVGGVSEAIKNLKKYQFIKTEACKIVLKRHAFNIERATKEVAPVRYGRLKASYSVNWSGSNMGRAKIKSPCKSPENPSKPADAIGKPSGPKELVYVVGSNVKYSPAQEFGGKGREPRPHLYPAYFMYEGEIVKDIGKVFKKDMKLG